MDLSILSFCVVINVWLWQTYCKCLSILTSGSHTGFICISFINYLTNSSPFLASPPLPQLHRQRARWVDFAPWLHPAAAGEQGALGGAASPAAPPGAAAPRAGGVQAPTTGWEAETYRAAEGTKETAGGGEHTDDTNVAYDESKRWMYTVQAVKKNKTTLLKQSYLKYMYYLSCFTESPSGAKLTVRVGLKILLFQRRTCVIYEASYTHPQQAGETLLWEWPTSPFHITTELFLVVTLCIRHNFKWRQADKGDLMHEIWNTLQKIACFVDPR